MSGGEGEGTVRGARDGALFAIEFDRPAKLNGFTPKMLRELAEAYTAFERDPSARVAVVSAVGAHFTAGLDLPKVAPLMARGEPLFPADAVDPFDLRPPRRSKPVVVAVKGIAYTLGLELLLAADIVVAADDCRFSQLEVKRGIMAAGGASLRMAQRAGWGNAMLALLAAGEFGPDEALRWGFVQEIAPAGQELARAREIAAAIAAQAPLAVQATLLNARRALEEGFAAAIGEFNAVNQRLSVTADAREGVRSFIEKRPPAYRGE
jgi:enoyl-CoA hydratase/carnithine racemase